MIKKLLCEERYPGDKKNGDPADGWYSDGYGNMKKIPTTGFSKIYTVDDSHYRYDYSKREIQWYEKGTVVYSSDLDPREWLDNPQYWAEYFHNDILGSTKS